MKNLPWVIIGAGRLGKTLGLLAPRLDVPRVITWNRGEAAASATREVLVDAEATWGEPLSALSGVTSPRIIWLTVVDDAVADLAASIAGSVEPDDLVIHTSGVASADVLRNAGLVECSVGSIHVLQAITDPFRAVERLGDSTWSVQGDDAVIDFARWMLERIDVEPLVIEGDAKVLYHASAVTAANLLVSLMDAAFEMAERAGLTREEARTMLLPLAASSVENVEQQSASDALSGPVARGDRSTIELHREFLAELEDENLADIYDALTERAKRLAPERWPDDED